MPSLSERVSAEADPIIREQEEAARVLAEEVAIKSRKELERIQAETQARLTKQLEKDVQVKRLSALLEQLGARNLLEQVKREVWGNIGELREYHAGLALISPVYVKNVEVSWEADGDDGRVGGTYYAPGHVVEFMSIIAAENSESEAPNPASLERQVDILYVDREIEVPHLYSDSRRKIRSFPSSGDLSDVVGRNMQATRIQWTSIEDTRARIEAEIVSSSAKRKASGRLPKDLVANSLPWPDPSLHPLWDNSWLAKAKRALGG